MNPEKQQLIHELLGADERRAATLLVGARILRRRRRGRVAMRGLVFALVTVVVGFWVERTNSHKRSIPVPSQAAVAPAPAPAQPRSLTDDELLALFPDTPVGLATLSDGKRRLIFPHAGDEQRFITRL